MRISPDAILLWQYGFVKINATIVFTWALMLAMTLAAILITRRLSRSDEIGRASCRERV